MSDELSRRQFVKLTGGFVVGAATAGSTPLINVLTANAQNSQASAIDYSKIAEWVFKHTGYHTGEMVKYEGNIFIASYWAGEKPGLDPGWALYDELYDVTSKNQTEQPKIIAYIPTWRRKEGFNYRNVGIYQNITHGIISFLMFSEINLGEFEANSLNEVNTIIEDVVTTGHQNGTYISIALGGASDYGFLNLMTAIGNNAAAPLLDKAVQNVKNFVKLNNLDGVDLDLECWWDKNGDGSKDQGGRQKSDGAHPAGYALTLFAQKLKEAMPDKLVSAAVFATSWYGNNYDPKIADYADWIGIMTYDLTGSWNQSPVGPHTSLRKIRKQDSFAKEQQGAWPVSGRGSSNGADPMLDNPILSVEDALWYWSNPFFMNWQGSGQKLPRNKIVAGVPIYGYDFAYKKDPDSLSGQIPPGYKVIRYKDILSQFPNANTAVNGNIKVSGNTPRPSFLSASGNYPYAHNIYFETPETASTKLNFLKQVGAQGVIIWEISNDVWEDQKSIIKALYKNSGNQAIKAPIKSDGQRYNEKSFLCTHNSFTNPEDAWVGTNQSMSITNQLKNAVRALMLDTHYEEPGFLDFANVIPEPGVYLLHGVNEKGWILGYTYALPSRRLYQALYEVWNFLNDNPNEIVTIFLEDYTTAEQLEAELQFIVDNETNEGRDGQKFLQLIYNPHKDSNWEVIGKKQWPLLSDLIAWNKRLIIFSSDVNKKGSNYVAYGEDYTKENYWSIWDIEETIPIPIIPIPIPIPVDKWDCPSRWNDGEYKDADYPKLFVFNHYRQIAAVITSAFDNTYDKIMDRIDNQCWETAKQLPNFVAVDFFEAPPSLSKAQDAVNELNRRWQNNEGYKK